MKKSILTKALLSLLTVIVLLCGGAYAMSDVQVVINDRPVAFDVPPVLEEGRVLVPLRIIAENLGCTVQYQDGTIKIASPNGIILLTIGSSEALVNGAAVLLDVPAQVRSGRTLVPLRFVGENLNADVEWYGVAKTVFIATENDDASTTETPQLSNIWSKEVLAELNAFRTERGFAPLQTADELNTRAYIAATHLAAGKTPLGTVPAPCTAESYAEGCSSLSEAVSLLLNTESSRMNILGGGTAFCGIGCTKDETGLFYIVLDFVDSQAFFTGERYKIITEATCDLTGYTINEAQNIEIYRISEQNKHQYTAKEIIEATVTNNKFHARLFLTESGQYLAFVADDAITLIVP